MKLVLVAVAAAAIAATAVAASRPTSSTPGLKLLPPAAPAGQQTLFGHIRALKHKTRAYELRFDPTWFTTGLTAARAQFEDTGSGQVANDSYKIEEGHRLLTYLVPPTAQVTVLTRTGAQGLTTTGITVAELARIVNGGSHRPLFEPLESGVWIRVRIDRVLSIDQQYVP